MIYDSYAVAEDAVGMPVWQWIQDFLPLWNKAFATRLLCGCLDASSSWAQQMEQGPDPANALPCLQCNPVALDRI